MAPGGVVWFMAGGLLVHFVRGIRFEAIDKLLLACPLDCYREGKQ